ncbi:MAG TPA: amino acid permease [Gammaproteobacteria bacterium]
MSEPKRRLSLQTAAAIVVGNMIGTGVFTTSGFALADLRSQYAVMLAWLIGGILAMFGALSYGALARRIPESGGEYTFLGQLVHPLAGFLAGWVSLLVGFTVPIAAAALALAAYLSAPLGNMLAREWIGTIALLIVGALHGLKLSAGVALQNGAVVLMLLVIGAFIVIGIGSPAMQWGANAAIPLAEVEISAFAVTLIWISFAYSGWNAAVYVAGEIRDPERNLQRSLWLATGLVTISYLALNAIFLFSTDAANLAGQAEVAAIAADALGGSRLSILVSVMIALGLLTSVSAMVMIGPRVYARMADDGLFPKFFETHGEVPSAAIGLQIALAIAVVWIADLRELLGYIGFTLGLSAAATVTSLIWLRTKEGPERVPVPGFPWIPGIFVVFVTSAAVFMMLRQPYEAGIGLLTVLAGLPMYWVWRRRS